MDFLRKQALHYLFVIKCALFSKLSNENGKKSLCEIIEVIENQNFHPSQKPSSKAYHQMQDNSKYNSVFAIRIESIW